MRRKAHMIHSRTRHIYRVWTFYVQGWRIRKGGTGARTGVKSPVDCF